MGLQRSEPKAPLDSEEEEDPVACRHGAPPGGLDLLTGQHTTTTSCPPDMPTHTLTMFLLGGDVHDIVAGNWSTPWHMYPCRTNDDDKSVFTHEERPDSGGQSRHWDRHIR